MRRLVGNSKQYKVQVESSRPAGSVLYDQLSSSNFNKIEMVDCRRG
jgi:hypothetical protein